MGSAHPLFSPRLGRSKDTTPCAWLAFQITGAALLPLALLQCGQSTDCASYLPTTVAAMRRASGSGCFELQHVVVVARNPSASVPRVYVHDQTGGPSAAAAGPR